MLCIVAKDLIEILSKYEIDINVYGLYPTEMMWKWIINWDYQMNQESRGALAYSTFSYCLVRIIICNGIKSGLQNQNLSPKVTYSLKDLGLKFLLITYLLNRKLRHKHID